MFRKIGLLCAAVAMFSIAGGQWAVLQSVAWLQMLVSYSEASGSLAAAIDHTFDGQHPCELCRNIQAAKSREHKGSPAASTAKEDAPVKALSTDPTLRQAERLPARMVLHNSAAAFSPSRTEAPPTPPPRSGLVAA